MMTLDKFEEAAEKVKEVVLPTNLIYSEYFSAKTGNKVYLKPENMQYTGAYKVRGAYYKISTLPEDERQKGLVTASAGNHAQGVAYAAKLFNVPATIVMPEATPLLKVNRTKSYGAEVVLYGSVYDEASQYALKLAEEKGAAFIHPFNDETVATGQGTIAMEIFKELPTVDIILVPIGGGGLAAGVSTLAKLLNPNIMVIGVEPAGASCMKASLNAGEVVTLPDVETIADGTAVKTPGNVVFPYIQENIDQIGQIFLALHSPQEFSGLAHSKDGELTALRNGENVPISLMSTGQRTALVISVFFQMNLATPYAPKFLLLDEPVANIDDLNVLALMDFLRELVITHKRQIFFTTANRNVARLFRRKFSFLLQDFQELRFLRAKEQNLEITRYTYDQSKALEPVGL